MARGPVRDSATRGRLPRPPPARHPELSWQGGSGRAGKVTSTMSGMEISSHHSRLLQQLNEQRRQDLFCDCHILVEGKAFKAHRNVLFASSGYFKMLLSQSSREQSQPTTATFEVFSPDTFHVILDFVYTGKLSLNGQTVIEVMSAASYLQMTDVIGACKTFIKSSLDINEKEKDDFYSLSDKDMERDANSNGAEQADMYGIEWEVAESSPEHSNAAPEGGASTAGRNSWSVYNYYQTSQRNTQQQQVKQEPRQDTVKKHRLLRAPEPNDVPHYKQSKVGPTAETGKAPKIKGQAPQSEEPLQIDVDADADTVYPLGPATELTPRSWTVNQPPTSRRSNKSKSSKADELYATMPTILGVVGGWGEDELPRMRFKCPFCTHMVKRKADLKRHLRCHTGERPYPCEACGKRFTRLEHLRSHFRTIHQAGKPICRKCKRHVTDQTGQVVQEGTRRYRLCNECLSEAGVDSIPIDLDDEEDDESSLVFSPSPDDDKDAGWQYGDEHKSDAEIAEDGSSDLVIHQVDDSDDEVEENETKPIVS